MSIKNLANRLKILIGASIISLVLVGICALWIGFSFPESLKFPMELHYIHDEDETFAFEDIRSLENQWTPITPEMAQSIFGHRLLFVWPW